ncbi:DUF72 domain-containing protein [bacterium]|nr:DUF72 domain-containing protein [bacterium]
MTIPPDQTTHAFDTLYNLHIGTSSWTFADWRDVFYPPTLAVKDQLSWYTTQFNSVEVNTSFYALPAPSTVLQWVENAPAEFTYALKAPRLITHEKKLVDCRTETLAYLDVLRSLGPLAAPGFLQFPAQFTRARYGRILADYLDWLAGELNGLRLAVEVRAVDLITEAFARFLAERAMSLVVIERTGTPDHFDAWQAAKAVQQTATSTGAFLFVRIIGNDRDPLPNDRELQRPQEEILDAWAQRIAFQLDQETETFVYIHNPFEGHSPASVRRLLARVDSLHPLPVWSPPLTPPDQQDDSGQLSLF